MQNYTLTGQVYILCKFVNSYIFIFDVILINNNIQLINELIRLVRLVRLERFIIIK